MFPQTGSLHRLGNYSSPIPTEFRAIPLFCSIRETTAYRLHPPCRQIHHSQRSMTQGCLLFHSQYCAVAQRLFCQSFHPPLSGRRQKPVGKSPQSILSFFSSSFVCVCADLSISLIKSLP